MFLNQAPKLMVGVLFLAASLFQSPTDFIWSLSKNPLVSFRGDLVPLSCCCIRSTWNLQSLLSVLIVTFSCGGTHSTSRLHSPASVVELKTLTSVKFSSLSLPQILHPLSLMLILHHLEQFLTILPLDMLFFFQVKPVCFNASSAKQSRTQHYCSPQPDFSFEGGKSAVLPNDGSSDNVLKVAE